MSTVQLSLSAVSSLLTLYNLLLSVVVVVLEAIFGVVCFLLPFIKRPCRYLRHHAPRDVATVGEYTFFFLLVALIWVLTIGSGRCMRIRHLLPPWAQSCQSSSSGGATGWANVMVTVFHSDPRTPSTPTGESKSIWSSSVARLTTESVTACFNRLMSWKTSTRSDHKDPEPPAYQLDHLIQEATKNHASSVCLLCYKPIRLKDPLLFLPCKKWHYFHVECAGVFVASEQRCPVCRGKVLKLEGDPNKAIEGGKGRSNRKKRSHSKK